jgi:protein SCO1/2
MALAEEKLHTDERTKNRSWGEQLTVRRVLLGFTLAIVVALAANWLAPWLQPYRFHGTLLQASSKAGDFTLDTSHGAPMRLSDFRGKYVLLYFGYTFCPDVCPMTLNDIKAALSALGDDAEAVQVLFVSVDPARDTVDQLASYLPNFDPTFIGMTGNEDMILQAATEFGIFYAHSEGATDGYYTVDHTSTVIVVDPEGYPRLVFPFGASGAEMAEDLQHLMR